MKTNWGSHGMFVCFCLFAHETRWLRGPKDINIIQAMNSRKAYYTKVNKQQYQTQQKKEHHATVPDFKKGQNMTLPLAPKSPGTCIMSRKQTKFTLI